MSSFDSPSDDLGVFIAAHKLYDLPTDNSYQPIHVGKTSSEVSLPYPGDDTGDNISALNNTSCELTALYWAWKNTQHDAYGLVHYRRYFAGKDGTPATGVEMRAMLSGVDVVVPRRRHYVVQTVAQHYASAHHGRDLEVVREVLAIHDPAAVPAFDAVMGGRKLVLYNMMLMHSAQFSSYCSWLFPLLEITRAEIPMNNYGPQQARVMGYLGERLLNVWLRKEPHLRVRYQQVVEIEPQSILVKGTRMVGRIAGFGRAE